MSKKEQKLKKNLYKALTEYFIHNAKNNLSSSENILNQLASFRMETGLPAALRQDKKYQTAQKNCNKANEKRHPTKQGTAHPSKVEQHLL